MSLLIFLSGLSIILCNLGSRFLHLDLDGDEMELLSHPYIRPLYIYSMAFMASRDFMISLWVTVFFYTVIFSSRLLRKGSPIKKN